MGKLEEHIKRLNECGYFKDDYICKLTEPIKMEKVNGHIVFNFKYKHIIYGFRNYKFEYDMELVKNFGKLRNKEITFDNSYKPMTYFKMLQPITEEEVKEFLSEIYYKDSGFLIEHFEKEILMLQEKIHSLEEEMNKKLIFMDDIKNMLSSNNITDNFLTDEE